MKWLRNNIHQLLLCKVKRWMRRKTEQSSKRRRNGIQTEVTVGDGRARSKIVSLEHTHRHTHFLSVFVDVSEPPLTSPSTAAEDNGPSHEKWPIARGELCVKCVWAVVCCHRWSCTIFPPLFGMFTLIDKTCGSFTLWPLNYFLRKNRWLINVMKAI